MRGINLEPDDVDAKSAQVVEDTVQLRLVEEIAAQGRSVGSILLHDSIEILGKAFIEPSLDQDTEAPAASIVVIISFHEPRVRPSGGVAHHPCREPPGVIRYPTSSSAASSSAAARDVTPSLR